jgi:peptidoglycan/LPS O-acetylase OafA/YrhL
MRKGLRDFTLVGLAAAVAAVVLAVWLGGGLTGQRTALIAAGVLAVGDTAAALWAAGGEERRRRIVPWMRCGLIAAALSFIGLWIVIIPAVFAGMAAGSGTQPALAYAALAFAIIAGAVVVWATHRFTWRRFAPKADA